MTDSATVDHIVPIVDCSDFFDEENLAACCYECNGKKGNLSLPLWEVIRKGLYQKNINEIKRANLIIGLLNDVTYTDTLLKNKDIRNLNKIQRIAVYARNFLLNHINNPRIVFDNIKTVEASIELVTIFYLKIKSKIYTVDIKTEYDLFFQRNKKWLRHKNKQISNN